MAIDYIKPGPRFAPVILAGGSGTRFWPRSRKARAKQVLALDGERTMIQDTLSRLQGLASPQDVWVITNGLLKSQIAEQLPELPAQHLLCEPAARNTAPACALAAFLLESTSPDTVIGIFPSDHVVKDLSAFTQVIEAGVDLARGGERMVVLGISPTRPETGYGYIEQGERVEVSNQRSPALPIYRVRRFTEKPDLPRAKQFIESGNYAWNSGIFLWSARTLANAIREHRPAIAPFLTEIAAAYGTPNFEQVFAEQYPKCESISIDYAVLEPRSAKGEGASEIYCLPANFEWSDLGSWAALYEHCCEGTESAGAANVVDAKVHVAIESTGSYVYAPGRTVALLGVEDLVVVVTDDAVLVTTRDRSQDVGRVTKALSEAAREDCL